MQGYTPALILPVHIYTPWTERGSVRVKCLLCQEHNAIIVTTGHCIMFNAMTAARLSLCVIIPLKSEEQYFPLVLFLVM